jgi:hypothetical protein
MHAVVNHVYPICQSRYSHTLTTIHASTTFPIQDGAFSPAFFYECRMWSQGAVVDGGLHCGSNWVGHRSSDNVFPQSREAAADFSSPPHCRCSLGFFNTCDTINFFCYCDFLDTCALHVHFASNINTSPLYLT